MHAVERSADDDAHCRTLLPVPVLWQFCARPHWLPAEFPAKTVLYIWYLLPKNAPPWPPARLFAYVTLRLM